MGRESGKLFIIIWPVLIQYNNRGRARGALRTPRVRAAMGPLTNTALSPFWLRAAEKFRQAEKLVLVLLLITNLVGFIRAKKKTCPSARLLFDESLCECVPSSF